MSGRIMQLNFKFAVTVALALLLVGCSSVDPTTSEEYQALGSQLAAAQQQLADVIVERDALADEALTAAARHDKVLANQEAVAEIIANPDSFGTEDEVLDLLLTYTVPGAVMDDVAFGAVDMRSAWRNTIFEPAADIETWATWTAEDGSMAGSLWIWAGRAWNGEPFELIGINTDLYDDDGLLTHELVQYPYKNDYVTGAIMFGNDQPVSDATSSAEIDATAVPVEVSALIDDWLAALKHADGSALDLYLPEGYHLYGDQRIDHDEILAHLQGEGIEHEWITEPLLLAQDEDGSYVAVRGLQVGSDASALLFEIVTTADGELRLAQTAWFYRSK